MKKRDLVNLRSGLKFSSRPASYLNVIGIRNIPTFTPLPLPTNQPIPVPPGPPAAYVTALYVSSSYVQNTD